MLRQSKVNENRLIILSAYYDIGRFHIKVCHIPRMNIIQCVTDFADIFNCFCLRQRPDSFDHLIEIFTLYVIHDIVSGIILLKYIMDLYYSRMVEFGYILGFFQKTVLKLGHCFGIVLCAKRQTARRIAVAILFREKLLDCDFLVKQYIFGKIGDTETSLSKNTDYTVFTVLKSGIVS